MNYKIILSLFIVICFILCVESKEYSCKWKNETGVPYSMNYSTSVTFNQYIDNKCDWLKKHDIKEYDICVNDCHEANKIFQKGGCKEIDYK